MDLELPQKSKKWKVTMRDHVTPKLPFEIEPKRIELTPHSVRTFDVRFRSDDVEGVCKTSAGLVAMLSRKNEDNEEEEDLDVFV